MRAGRWCLRRLRPSGARPLEVWNLPVAGGELWQRVGTPAVEAIQREGRDSDEIGRALATALLPALDDLHARLRFDGAFLGGGLLELDGMKQVLLEAALPFPLTFSTEGAFAGEAGGRVLLTENGGPEGAVVDVGQTSIKLSGSGIRRLRERDIALLPRRFIGTPRPAPSPASTAAFARFLAQAIADLLTAARPPDPLLVLALPCPVEDDLTPGPCTYGWEGHHALLPETFRVLDEQLRPWPGAERPEVLVLNDAELTAASARAALAPAPGTRLLALTLGFGPGAAVLDV